MKPNPKANSVSDVDCRDDYHRSIAEYCMDCGGMLIILNFVFRCEQRATIPEFVSFVCLFV